MWNDLQLVQEFRQILIFFQAKFFADTRAGCVDTFGMGHGDGGNFLAAHIELEHGANLALDMC